MAERKVMMSLDVGAAMAFVTERSIEAAAKAAAAVEAGGGAQRSIRLSKRTETFFNALSEGTGMSGQAAMGMCLDAMVIKTIEDAS